MFKKTLVCLDGSKLAESVIPFVIDACSRQEAELVLLQVITSHITIVPPQSIHTISYSRETKPGTTSASDMSEHFIPESGAGSELKEVEREQTKAKDYLEDLARELRAQGVKVRAVVLEGDIKETIIDHISNSKVTLVALTTHGAGGMNRNLLGSVAQNIMKESPVPVLLVKPQGKPVKKEAEEL